jgi:hypothetical protein
MGRMQELILSCFWEEIGNEREDRSYCSHLDHKSGLGCDERAQRRDAFGVVISGQGECPLTLPLLLRPQKDVSEKSQPFWVHEEGFRKWLRDSKRESTSEQRRMHLCVCVCVCVERNNLCPARKGRETR